MKNHFLRLPLCALMLGLAPLVLAGPDHKMEPYKGSAEFEKLKTLEGHWEGSSPDMGKDGKPTKTTVDYHTTSGGSAVVETLSKGTPHEMVTVYTDENKSIAATHYCMIGNQPHMTLKNSSASTIFLEADAKTGNVPMDSFHMHSLKLDMSTPNQLIQTWTSYKNGKLDSSSVFTFTRKS